MPKSVARGTQFGGQFANGGAQIDRGREECGVVIPDWRDNPPITILTSAQVETFDRKRLEIGREKDEAKRAKLIEAFEIGCLIMAVEADKWIDACR